MLWNRLQVDGYMESITVHYQKKKNNPPKNSKAPNIYFSDFSSSWQICSWDESWQETPEYLTESVRNINLWWTFLIIAYRNILIFWSPENKSVYENI